MNADHLGHIVRYPDEITVQDALELEELCRKFPAFSTPFLLLARYYHQKGDYRAEEAVQLAALRVFDREWLFDVVQGDKALHYNQETAAVPDVITFPEELLEEKANEVITDAGTTNPEPDTAAELQAAEPEAISVAEPEPESEPETVNIRHGQHMEKPGETTTAPMFEPAEIPVDHEPVFQEIQPLNTDAGAEALGITGSDSGEEGELVGFELSWEHLPDAGGLITPMTEEEAQETLTEVTGDAQVNTEVPFREEPQEEQVKPRLIRQAAVYDIEQYFQAESAVPSAPSDFYSWLKNPSASVNQDDEASDGKPSPDHRDELIDRFIRTNPSISRPKKEFFTPEAAAKKSESLPDYLVTETLAQVYLKQENPAGAIRIYEKLMLKFPEKTPYFAGLIEKIRKDHQL